MTTTDTTFKSEIKYDRETRDYACYLDGELVCFARTYHEAEITLDQLRYELLTSGITATASQLDADSDLDTIAADHAVVAPVDCATCGGAGECLDCEPVADRVLAELVSRVYFCFVEDCDRPHQHIVGEAPLCCLHYTETTGRACDCPDAGPAPLLATDLLDEADAALRTCPGAFAPYGADAHPSYAPYCQRCALALDRLAVVAYVQRLAEDIGLSCSFCGEAHAAADCPLRRPLVVPSPRVCGNCGGAHSIQACDELRAALFAADVFYAVAA